LSDSGIRMQELRPRVVDQRVADHRLDRQAVGPMRCTAPSASRRPSAGSNSTKLAHPRHAVMPGDHRRHLRRMAGDRPGVEGRIGPQRVAGVVLHLPRAVRVHVEQQPREIVRRIRVLPAGVQHAAVVQHRRAPVVVLVETQLARVAAVGVRQEQVGDHVAAADAGHAGEAPCRTEDDPAVGQVAGVVVVHVRLLASRDLPQPRAVGADLPDLPAAVVAGHREQHAVGIEVQIHVAHEHVRSGRNSVLVRPSGRGGASSAISLS
jgi:hypothetical protein